MLRVALTIYIILFRTLKKGMQKLTRLVERKIAAEMAGQPILGLAADGWGKRHMKTKYEIDTCF